MLKVPRRWYSHAAHRTGGAQHSSAWCPPFLPVGHLRADLNCLHAAWHRRITASNAWLVVSCKPSSPVTASKRPLLHSVASAPRCWQAAVYLSPGRAMHAASVPPLSAAQQGAAQRGAERQVAVQGGIAAEGYLAEPRQSFQGSSHPSSPAPLVSADSAAARMHAPGGTVRGTSGRRARAPSWHNAATPVPSSPLLAAARPHTLGTIARSARRPAAALSGICIYTGQAPRSQLALHCAAPQALSCAGHSLLLLWLPAAARAQASCPVSAGVMSRCSTCGGWWG